MRILGAVALAATVVVAVLVTFFGLRLEQDGGAVFIVSFSAPGRLQDRLEAHRAQQRSAGSANASGAVWASTKEPAPGAPEPLVAGPLDWAEFRGAARDGHYAGAIRTAWPAAGLPLLWKQPVGGGHAGFVVAGERAFTVEQRREQEVAAAYDLKTGRELWTHAWAGHFQEGAGGNGPRATPAWEAGRLYVLGAEGELRCLESATGRLVWRRNILRDAGAENLMFGMAASPLVLDDTLVTLPGGHSGKSVIAYDKNTGEPVWSALDDEQSYTAPMVATLSGRRQLVIVSADRIVGLDAAKGSAGRLLWEHPWSASNRVNGSQPILVDGEHLLLSGGTERGSKLLRISQTNGRWSASVVWENANMKSSFNSAVLHAGHLYGFDGAIFSCIDARTGEKKWKGGRYGYGQVILAGEHLIVITEMGGVVLLRATPEKHDELAQFQAIAGKAWNYPSLANGILLVRNGREMAAYGIGAER